MYLRVWDKIKEKDGKNEAIYELHTGIEENFDCMRTMRRTIENLLNDIEFGRFQVVLQDDDGNLLKSD